MITSSIMLCADRVIRDAQSNAISVINIFEEIMPEGLPLFIQRFMVFALLYRDTEEDPSKIDCKVQIRIGSKILIEQAITIDFKNKKRNRTIADIGGLVIPNSGILEVSIWHNTKMLNKVQFEIQEPRKVEIKPQKS